VAALLGLLLFEIEIGTGIGIDFLRFGSVRNGIFRDAAALSSQATQHRGHSIQLRLTHQTYLFIQRFADDQDILDGTTFQYCSSGDLKIPSPVRLCHLSVAFGNI
jgi:hypothetical protein